ncbi:hypothetical protein NC796_02665 [Aliifodinibius sp. S!AR15-10]|nr:hypothetical protein [Aliifodinibius sp. S!AR15-10]
MNYYLDVGIGIPASLANFTQNWNATYGAGAGISYEIRPSVKPQLYSQYHRFSFDEDGARVKVNVPQSITDIDGAEAEIFTAMLNGIYEYELPRVSTLTYASVGAVFFRSIRRDFTVSTANDTFTFDQRSESTLGISGTVGLRHAINDNFAAYAEAKVVTSFFVDRRTQYFPISIGIPFKFPL